MLFWLIGKTKLLAVAKLQFGFQKLDRSKYKKPNNCLALVKWSNINVVANLSLYTNKPFVFLHCSVDFMAHV